MRIIELEVYNENWIANFEKESVILKNLLSSNVVQVNHIGSTAIRGIKAKPVIDILLEVISISKIDDQVAKFEKIGYVGLGENGMHGRRFFYKGKEKRSHHIHIYEVGNKEIAKHKLFVEYMNYHKNHMVEYEKLKTILFLKYQGNPEKYCAGKGEYISGINELAKKWL